MEKESGHQRRLGHDAHEGAEGGDDIKKDLGEKGFEYSGIRSISSGENLLCQKKKKYFSSCLWPQL